MKFVVVGGFQVSYERRKERAKTFCLGSQNVRDSIPNEHQKKA